jgi:Ca2+-binding EF-hand superfamily protein
MSVQGGSGFTPAEEAWFAAGFAGRFDASPPAFEPAGTDGAARGGEAGAAWSARLTAPTPEGHEALVRAMQSQSAEELTATLAAAKRDDPAAYRSALREVLNPLLAGKSRLVRHFMAMDVNNDGSLVFKESYRSMRDMGFTVARTTVLSAATALVFGPQTHERFNVKVDVDNALKTERKFWDTGFDDDDRLEEKLDDLMRYDQDGDGYLTRADLELMVDDRVAGETSTGIKIVGFLNKKSEWAALMDLMGGKINRDELRDFYEGSLFYSFLEPDNLAKKIVTLRDAVGTEPIGAAALAGHDDAEGRLPGLATLSAGPDAGVAAGAAFGERMLLTPGPDSVVGNALLGGMAAMCPALAGGRNG